MSETLKVVKQLVAAGQVRISGHGYDEIAAFDKDSRPIHVVWGIPKGFTYPVVIVTAYRPDPDRWNETFTQRRGKK